MQNLSSDLLCGRILESRQNSGDGYNFPHYATQMRNRYQRIVHHVLAERGFASLLTFYKVRRRWSYLIAEVEELFMEVGEAAPLKSNREFNWPVQTVHAG